MKIALVVSDYNSDVTSQMLERVLRHAEFLQVEISHAAHVSGVYDMPLIVKTLLRRSDVDGLVMIGAVIKGETMHDELIANVAARAGAELALEYDKPVALGITGPGMTLKQAFDRIDNARRALESVVRTIETLKKIGD
ncbi:MAG: 6,7-dimethyl-8-ribityllumazine synthase [Candidatus Binataceae bacterium]